MKNPLPATNEKDTERCPFCFIGSFFATKTLKECEIGRRGGFFGAIILIFLKSYVKM